jgi:hypothetical protein
VRLSIRKEKLLHVNHHFWTLAHRNVPWEANQFIHAFKDCMTVDPPLWLYGYFIVSFETPLTWRARSPGWPSYTPGHWVPFCRLLRLAGLRWRYFNCLHTGTSKAYSSCVCLNITNYTDRATACRRSDCQLLQIKGATWSV